MDDIKNEETAPEEPVQDAPAEKKAPAQPAAPEKKHNAFSVILNKYFHHIDRGSQLKTEITAGIFICIITVCAMFMNLQLFSSVTLTGTTAENGETVASLWFWTMIIACAASLVMGLVARLPFTQTSGLGLSMVLMTFVGYSAGLTYYNLLAICFISSIVYTAKVAIPKVREWIYKVIPSGVKKAVPVAMGILIAFVAIQLSGAVTFGSNLISDFGAGSATGTSSISTGSILGFLTFDYTTDRFHPTLLLCFLFVIITVILILVFKARKAKHPYLWPLLISTVAYIVLCVLTVSINWSMMSLGFDALYGRAWMVGSEDTILAHLSSVFSNLSIGKVFTEGFVFNGNGGTVFVMVLTGILTMVFSFMFHSDAVIETAGANAGLTERDAKAVKVARICNAGANVIAPIFGVAPVEVSPESVGATEEHGKSGIVPVVAAIGFLISAFVWIIPAIFTTYTSQEIQMNLYGHYGVVLEMLTESGFGFVDAIMVVVGLGMVVHGIKNVNWKDWAEYVPFLAAVAIAFFTSCIAYGVAAGVVVSLAITLIRKPEAGKKKMEVVKSITISTWIVSAIMLLLLILAACM